MVSSVAPIKAKKLRYYADANFKRRVLPPPTLADGQYADAPPARADDWSGLAIPAVPAPLVAETVGDLGSADDGGPRPAARKHRVADACRSGRRSGYPTTSIMIKMPEIRWL